MRRTIEQDSHTIGWLTQLEAVSNDRAITTLGWEITQHIVKIDAVTGSADFDKRRVQQLTQSMNVTTHDRPMELTLQRREYRQEITARVRSHTVGPR
jgi:hypothetical protein